MCARQMRVRVNTYAKTALAICVIRSKLPLLPLPPTATSELCRRTSSSIWTNSTKKRQGSVRINFTGVVITLWCISSAAFAIFARFRCAKIQGMHHLSLSHQRSIQFICIRLANIRSYSHAIPESWRETERKRAPLPNELWMRMECSVRKWRNLKYGDRVLGAPANTRPMENRFGMENREDFSTATP